MCDGYVCVWEKASERAREKERETETCGLRTTFRSCFFLLPGGFWGFLPHSRAWQQLYSCDHLVGLKETPLFSLISEFHHVSSVFCAVGRLRGSSPAATLERNIAAAPGCTWSESVSQSRPSMDHHSCFLVIESFLNAVPCLRANQQCGDHLRRPCVMFPSSSSLRRF